MTDITVHSDDTTAFDATLPRDLTDASVEFLIGSEESHTVAATVRDGSNGKVAIPFSKLSLSPGVREVKFKITYGDGTVEKLPAEGDVMRIYD